MWADLKRFIVSARSNGFGFCRIKGTYIYALCSHARMVSLVLVNSLSMMLCGIILPKS